jgi:hypothetical protein
MSAAGFMQHLFFSLPAGAEGASEAEHLLHMNMQKIQSSNWRHSGPLEELV